MRFVIIHAGGSMATLSSRRWLIAITLLLAVVVGVAWDVLAAAVLFHRYSFFESVVVCLLVMMLCAVFTVIADVERWSDSFSKHLKNIGGIAPTSEPDPLPDVLHQLRALLRVLFYAVAFVMALVELVLTLIQ
jgi:hypothetical protein